MGLVTLASLFYKPDETWEWPKNRNFVIFTVIVYWSLTGLFYYVDNYMAGDTFFQSYDHKVSRSHFNDFIRLA